MKQLGFNIVRLPIIWKAIEPRPNPNLERLLPEGQKYLTLVKEVINALFLRGLFVILDFHQDIAHEVYGGDGFPDWALAIDETHERPPQSNFKDEKWGLHYYKTLITKHDVLVRHTLRSFWRNSLRNKELTEEDLVVNTGKFPRTHLERTIGATARFFRSVDEPSHIRSAILGYEPFNEPHPVGIKKSEFEAEILPSFYSSAITEIRRSSLDGVIGDDKAFVFIEPRVDWTTYAA